MPDEDNNFGGSLFLDFTLLSTSAQDHIPEHLPHQISLSIERLLEPLSEIEMKFTLTNKKKQNQHAMTEKLNISRIKGASF